MKDETPIIFNIEIENQESSYKYSEGYSTSSVGTIIQTLEHLLVKLKKEKAIEDEISVYRK